MIKISGKSVRPEEIGNYPRGGTEKAVLDILSASDTQYQYSSPEQLKFELQLRAQIVAAARELSKSDFGFAVFRKSRCNPAYWDRTREGGFVLKPGAKPSDAINDIFANSSLYATECATAMMIIYYRALLKVYGDELFNRVFPRIQLMNWHHLDGRLQDAGNMFTPRDYLPGDRRYFNNPDVDPLTPEWQGENTIDLGNGLYYGHGIGVYRENEIIQALSEHRSDDADDMPRLMKSVGRPDFKSLAEIYLNR